MRPTLKHIYSYSYSYLRPTHKFGKDLVVFGQDISSNVMVDSCHTYPCVLLIVNSLHLFISSCKLICCHYYHTFIYLTNTDNFKILKSFKSNLKIYKSSRF